MKNKKAKKFQPTFQMKYCEPYQTAKRPNEGPNSIMNLNEMVCVDIEVRGAGKGLWHGEEAEYMDIRVYTQPKNEVPQ